MIPRAVPTVSGWRRDEGCDGVGGVTVEDWRPRSYRIQPRRQSFTGGRLIWFRLVGVDQDVTGPVLDAVLGDDSHLAEQLVLDDGQPGVIQVLVVDALTGHRVPVLAVELAQVPGTAMDIQGVAVGPAHVELPPDSTRGGPVSAGGSGGSSRRSPARSWRHSVKPPPGVTTRRSSSLTARASGRQLAGSPAPVVSSNDHSPSSSAATTPRFWPQATMST